MVSASQSLTAAEAEAIRVVHAQLRSGDMPGARSTAQALVRQIPGSADAWQVLAMASAETGDVQAADDAFARAYALAPRSEVVVLNFVRWLRSQRRLDAAMRVLEAADATPAVLLQHGQVALQRQDARLACDLFRRVVAGRPGSAAGWLGLGNALRALGDYEAAEPAFRKVVDLEPSHAAAWFGLGVVVRLLGRIGEALSALQHARALGLDSPDLHNAINGTLYDAGRSAEAVAGARTLLQQHPDHVAGHEMLVNLLWETGSRDAPADDPLAVLRIAAQRRPHDRELQLAFARMLLSARQPDEALDVLNALHRHLPGDPLLAWYAGEAHSALGQHGRAAHWFEAGDRGLHDNVGFLNARARHAFRAGQPELAATCASHAVRIDPAHPEAWSYLGIAWRLSDDPREFWLFDYDRLVAYVDVAPPAGHADMPSFLRALTGTLDEIHVAGHAPINQSVRTGSQTPGRLFGRDHATLRAAATALQASVDGWLRTLPRVEGHPFLSRVRDRNRIVGSWSVRLQSSGRHANHIHGEGWLSSAFYVSLPPSISADDDPGRAGWIQFGQPLEELGLDLPPRKLLRPEAGKLALFPSYMWHGTIPFHDAEPRLTIAFDVQAG